MKNYLKAGVNLVGQGLLELMHVIFILSIGVLTYYLVGNLPIDHMIAIALSIGAGLLAAYGVYGPSRVILVASSKDEKIHPINFNNMDPSYSHEPDNIYFFDKH